MFEKNRLEIFKSIVLFKGISSGGKGIKTYSIEISSRKDEIKPRGVLISKSYFNKIQEGVTVSLLIGKRRLGIHWFVVV